MKTPGFSVVASVCVLLGLLGLGLRALRPFLPPQEANRLAMESDEFLRQASNQQINWMVLDEKALAEAKRLSKPILLLMGTAATREARMADGYIFSDQDIQSYLERNFVCVRVDLDAQPYWGNAFMPVSRTIMPDPKDGKGVSPTFQIWFLDGQGLPFYFYGRVGAPPLNDPNLFLDELADVRERYEQYIEYKAGKGEGKLEIEPPPDDGPLFEVAGKTILPIRSYSQNLLSYLEPKWGGFPIEIFPRDPKEAGYLQINQAPRPMALNMLMADGNLAAASVAINPMLRSGIVDWLDGGFFRRARSVDWTNIEFDKQAVPNAEAMKSVALFASLTSDRFAERIAKNAFESLASEFIRAGFVATARVGDENAFGRSSRSSFSAKDVRKDVRLLDVQFWGSDLLTSEEALATRDLFHLRVEVNPQMNLRVSGPDEFNSKMFEEILAKLRKSKENVKLQYTKNANAFVNGVVAANMYLVARLWSTERNLHLADERFAVLTAFGTGSDISHYSIQRPQDLPYLGDYLAVAEACLQRFLATGDAESLRRGSSILSRAHLIFDSPYGLTPTIGRVEHLIPKSNYPQVVDSNSEALTARVIRLDSDYGRLLVGTTGAESKRFLEGANEESARAANFLNLGPRVAGIAYACANVVDDTHAIVVGPSAVSLANRLFQAAPTRLVAPAVGLVRPDLQKREPGIYIVGKGIVEGPFTLDEATAKLSPKLNL